MMIVPWLETGGADRCNLDIARYLKQQGWHVTIVATLACSHRWEAYFREVSDDVFILPRLVETAAAYDFLEHLLSTRQPDGLLISNAGFAYDIVTLLRKRFPNLFLVDLNHMEESWAGGGYPGFAARCTQSFDRHWVVSQHLKNWLLARGVPPEKIDVLHWFADDTVWQPSSTIRRQQRQRLGIGDDEIVIAYIGRICRQKRPDLFAAVLARLAACGSAFKALVIGDGDLLPTLRNDLQRRHLMNNVNLLGWQAPERVRELMQASDIFFLPSENEGIALVLYEAMACGLVVVAGEVGGQAELVSRDCGELVSADTPEEAVDRYVAILDRLLSDPRRLAEMGRAACRRIHEGFDTVHFNERLQQCIERIPRRPFEGPVGAVPDVPRQALARLDAQWTSSRILEKLPLARWPLWFSQSIARLIKGVCLLRYSGFKVLLAKLMKSAEST